MTLEELKILYQLEEEARSDPHFLQLEEACKTAFQPFWELWQAMDGADSQAVDDYLHAAVELYQHFLVLALRYTPQ